MKILIYGAGVIGCTYGWQLAKSGHDISILVRKGKKQDVENNGIKINCIDYRNNKKIIENIVFHPHVIDELCQNNDFEYIIVTTNNLYLNDILPVLAEKAGKAHILFFQNIWYNDLDIIKNHLLPKQYFFGFPFMVGGGRRENEVNSIISGSKYSKTMLGEIDGKVSIRVQKISEAMENAYMKPFVSDQIITWLIPHYAFIAGIGGGILKAGGTMDKFIHNSKIIKETIMSIREGFHVCLKMGINPRKEKVNKLYYLPLFISCPVVKKVFSDAAMQGMFDAYLENSANEVKAMINNIISYGKKSETDIKYLKLP